MVSNQSENRQMDGAVDFVFAGSGDLRDFYREFAWASTSLGAVGKWPSALKTAAKLCLDSPVSMALMAGPDLLLIYNDPFEQTFFLRGAARPASEAWPGLWKSLGPRIDKIWRSRNGQASGGVYRRDGKDYSFSLVLDDNGEVVGIMMMATNAVAAEPNAVSGRDTDASRDSESAPGCPEFEQALRLSEGRYRALFESIDDGFCVVEVLFDRSNKPLDYRFLEVNPAFSKQTGIENAVGRWMREIKPDQEDSWYEIFGRVALTGESARFEKVAKALGRIYNVHASRVGEPEQRQVAILFSDISESKRAIEALRESEQQFRALVTATSDSIYQMSPDWSEMRQLRGRGFIGDTSAPIRNWLDRYILPEDRKEIIGAISDAVELKKAFELEHRVRRSDGTIGWSFSRAVPLKNKNGEIYEWFGAASDVTERRQTEERLRESDRQKDQFLAMLGHELRNPLAAIRHATEVVRLTASGEPRLQRAYGVLERQSAHMTRLIDGLLEVSRIARGKIRLSRKIMDLRTVAESVIQDQIARIGTRDLAIVPTIAAEPVWVLGDRVRLVQVLDNLVANAIKYTDAPGTVYLTVKKENSQAVVRVRDTGVGLRPEVIPDLFKPFYQEQQDISRTSGGLGLGLALAKGLVELHSGSITAGSEGPGKGAVFEVRFPLSVAPLPLPTETRRKPVNLRRILIVEDSVDAGTALADLLKMQGHQVILVATGVEALQILNKWDAEVVLCDLGLPGMSGYDVARAVRADEKLVGLPLIALTGYGQPEDRKQTDEAGFNEHLVKPVDLETLNNVLERFSQPVTEEA